MMNITITQPVLSRLLETVKPAISRRSTIPIMSCVLLDNRDNNLTVVGNDMEMELSAVTRDYQHNDSGAVAIDAEKAASIVKALPKETEIRLSESSGRVTISAGRSRYSIGARSSEDYPRRNNDKKTVTLTVDAKKMVNAMKSVTTSMAENDVRFYLNGMFLSWSGGRLTMVGTDGHRLAQAEIDADHQLDGSAIVPRKTIFELIKLADKTDSLEIGFALPGAIIVNGTYNLSSKLIDGKYPDYQRVLPSSSTDTCLITVNRQWLRSALARVMILSSDNIKGAKIRIGDNTLILSAQNSDGEEATDTLEVITEHLTNNNDIVIGVNGTYLSDALAAHDSELIMIAVGDSGRALRLTTGEDDSPLWVLMPMLL